MKKLSKKNKYNTKLKWFSSSLKEEKKDYDFFARRDRKMESQLLRNIFNSPERINSIAY